MSSLRQAALAAAGAIFAVAAPAAAYDDGYGKGDKDGSHLRIVASIAGFVGLGSNSDSNSPFDVFGGEGRVQVPLIHFNQPSRNQLIGVRQFLSLQGDVAFDSWRFDGSDWWNFAQLIGHLTYNNVGYHLTPTRAANGTTRNQFNLDPSWRIGVYGGLLDAQWKTRHFVAGVEGQAYLGNDFQIEARAGVFSANEVNLNAAYLAGRYFVNPNLYLQVSAAAGQIEDDRLAALGGRLEYKFGRSPVALFGELTWGQHSDDFTVHDWRIGARFIFGEPTLKADLVKGASLGRDLQRMVWLAD